MSDNLQPRGSDDATFAQPLYTPIKRRSFFMYAGATAGATALVLAGCSKDSDNTPTNNGISLGSGDVGVLNYAYALEQLEAAFYAQVVKTPAADFKAGELAYFTQVAAHEAIHRDFFKAALTNVAKVTPLQDLTPNFSSIDFTKRDSVLGTGKAFEDLGVAAYNGAGKLLKTPDFLVLAGKIVSVEARHAAFLRDLITPGSFAADDQVDANGLDKAMTPAEVLAIAGKYITQTLNADNVGK
ncbi:Tat (twin-arginine translocation) pathway signal sequence containing protein [Hymenobacter sedentarius]|uniref:Tat (Twin-arginine translocation) pathway signal sequence containing protein n=1 Tax=Hymenobacter sedentarius TaxID=1411621 RepID=A0A0U4BX08_9BACT|nr:ferritin-like domain-containing protein [Hymenobacter sedentarius]ALW84769.1 Tat (twin-arginine translocation) pathway signal sequence containing protein [Hymenobacter sedentarius]